MNKSVVLFYIAKYYNKIMSSYTPITAVPPVSIKFSLKSKLVQSNIKALLIDELSKIEDSKSLIRALDPVLIKYVAQLIENMIPSGNSKLPPGQQVDKFKLLVDVFSTQLQLSDDEQKKIKSIVEFLIFNKDIRKTSVKLFLRSLPKFFLDIVGF